jgi:hypothetical protein
VKGNPRYIIALIAGDHHTKRHEFQHARYHLDASYRESVQALWSNLGEKKRDQITSFLKKLGYSDQVLIDEFQAYYMTEKKNFFGMVIE